MIKQKATLLLADGTVFHGSLIGKAGTNGGEICFNTGMTGYQEIYTDPSYTGQIVVTTTSHIGNYGVHAEEIESDHPCVAGIVVNSFSEVFSRLDASGSLQDYLVNYGITGIADIDTRKLVRHLRSKGAMNAIISSEFEGNIEGLTAELAKVPDMNGLELSSSVCTQEPFFFGDQNAPIKVACLDFGIKKNILRNLASRGVYCKVFPAKTKLNEMEEWEPQAYFLSNGPGDPAVMEYAVKTTKDILDTNKPLFGICLGHQILAEACGISTYKMHHGHRGLNHPVKNVITGRSEITTQNHGFGVNPDAVKAHANVEISHVNLNDDSIEGIKLNDRPAFSVQYHPEATPGPHDSRYLFDDFIAMIKERMN